MALLGKDVFQCALLVQTILIGKLSCTAARIKNVASAIDAYIHRYTLVPKIFVLH